MLGVKLLRVLVCVLACWQIQLAWSAPLEVQHPTKVIANPAMLVCVGEPEATLVEIQTLARSGACQSEQPSDSTALVARGLDNHAFWIRMELRNNAEQTVERWLQVGHPRLEEVSMLLSNGDRLEVGIGTPAANLGLVPRYYGALPIVLQAHTSEVVWLRVRSRTLVDLGVTIWPPDALMQQSGTMQLSLTLALGGLLAALIYSLLGFVLTRELPYFFFCMAMAGETLLETFRAGILQRYLWPANEPMPVEMAACGSLIATTGFVFFFYTFVPGLRQQRLLFPTYAALVIATVLSQLASILLDYPAAAVQAWSILIYGLLLVGVCMLWVAWRQGFGPAGTLLLGFGLLLLPEGLRLASMAGLLPFLRVEYFGSAWALVLITPVLFAGLSQRSRELRGRLDAEQAEHQAKIEFLTRMSHELRTPLDTILGHAQLLRRGATERPIAEGLQHIQHSGKHLLKMIDEVLDYSRGIAGKLRIQPAPVLWPEFLHRLEQSGRILAGKGNNHFELHASEMSEPCLMLDEHRLQQILDNLLSNAARHTHDGLIRVDCRLHSGTLYFDVSDNGEGIAPADLQRIFLPFERGSRTGRGDGKGVGMGLAIARQLVQRMGGELIVSSTLGQGACFSFSVQTSVVNEEPQGVPTISESRSGQHYTGAIRTILLVDDNPESLKILETLLLSSGFKVLPTTSARNAVHLLRSTVHVDLVIADQRMNDGDGWTVLEAASGLPAYVPVILISAELPRRPANLDAGVRFAAELLRPLDHALLLQHLTSALDLHWEQEATVASLPAPLSDTGMQLKLARPPASDLQQLLSCIEAGQITAIQEWALRIQKEQPACTPFAQAVHSAAGNLDFSGLRSLATAGHGETQSDREPQ